MTALIYTECDYVEKDNNSIPVERKPYTFDFTFWVNNSLKTTLRGWK